MMAVALFGATELSVRASRAASAQKARQTWAFASGAWILSVLSKEFAVFWPLFLAIEAAVAAERGRERQKKQLLLAGAAALGGSIVYLSIRAAFMPITPPELDTLRLPLLTRAGYVLLSVGYYAERLVFPWPQTFHFRPVAVLGGTPVLFWPSVVAGAAVVAATGVWLAAAWKKDKTLAAMIAVLVLSSLPIVNVTYTGLRSATQDRFVYLPLFLLATAAARHGRKLLEAWGTRSRLAPVLLGAVALVFLAINWNRSTDYTSDEALWRHELELEPDNPHALTAMATTLAASGDTEEAVALLRRSLEPAALRYKLLANPTNAYVGLLAMQGPRLADGNVSALSALLAHVVDLVRGAKLKSSGRAGDLVLRPPVEGELFRVHVANSAAYLAASGALVASRIGRDDIVRLLVASVDDKAPLDVAGRYNLAIALGRYGDYSGARHQLAVAAALPNGSSDYAPALSGLEATLEAVKEQRLRASAVEGPARALARGRAFLELGAYLRAARALREAYALSPDDTAVRLAYFDALVSARLESDARAVAEKIFGEDEAPERIAETEKRLTPRTARAMPPAAHERWWLRPPGVREE
jgi:tetratricopeptide (TPR) repeat protein